METKVNVSGNAMVNSDLIAKLKAAAAAKYNVAIVAPTTSKLQEIKDLTRTAKARITLANTLSAIQSYVSVNEIDTKALDFDKTAKTLVNQANKALATFAKDLQERAEAGKDVQDIEMERLKAFSIDSEMQAGTLTIEFQYTEAPETWKGLVMYVDFSQLRDEAVQVLHGFGITPETPIGLLTALSYDVNANSVFARIAGADVKAGSKRLSIKAVTPLDGANDEEALTAFNEKVAQLQTNVKDTRGRISDKSFNYVAIKLREKAENQVFKDKVPALLQSFTTSDANGNTVYLPESEILKAVANWLEGLLK